MFYTFIIKINSFFDINLYDNFLYFHAQWYNQDITIYGILDNIFLSEEWELHFEEIFFLSFHLFNKSSKAIVWNLLLHEYK